MEALGILLYVVTFVLAIEIYFSFKRDYQLLGDGVIFFPNPILIKKKKNKKKGNIYLYHSFFLMIALFFLAIRLEAIASNFADIVIIICFSMIISFLYLLKNLIVRLLVILLFLSLTIMYYIEEYLNYDFVLYILIFMNLILILLLIRVYLPSNN